jgi:hypothetical protein
MIKGTLSESGVKYYIDKYYFNTLKELKEFYNIKKLVKNGKNFAFNSRGNKIEWIEYIAEKEIENDL